MQSYDVIIVGTGPAGLTAAIYASRANLKPLLLEGPEPGGQLTTTTEVDNFPGFPEGIQGPQLIQNMKSQAQRFGTEFLQKSAIDVNLSKRPFTVTLDDGQILSAQTLIISTGASAKYLGLKMEKELIGKGVSACATCDGFFYKNKIVHVIGGGDTAMEEATFLTKFAEKVYIVHRRDSLRASKPMQQRAFDNKKIEFVWNSAVDELVFDESGLTGIKVKNTETGEITERPTDGLFYGIGHTPNTKFLNGQVETDQHGFVKTQMGHPKTNIPGVFACGDVQDPIYRQAITAAGSGCQAAIQAERFLEENGKI